jgi:hypothetical protein
MGYVYLLLEVDANGDESHKIGITKNDPTKRSKALQTGNPSKIGVLKAYESNNYRMVEKWLHGRFNMKRTLARNEWFKLSDEDVLTFLDECKKGDDITTFMKKENPFFG